MVEALVSAYYDVTDSLAYFLCRRVPDHKAALLGTQPTGSATRGAGVSQRCSDVQPQYQHPINGHFLISTRVISNDMGQGSGVTAATTQSGNDWMPEARRRLKNLNSLAFEDLCIDVYDEAERRLTNSILETLDQPNETSQTGRENGHFSSKSGSTEPSAALVRSLMLYFLPPNTVYSSIRNQARQKLGRLSALEFHTLVIDILTEAAARLMPLFPPRPETLVIGSQLPPPLACRLPSPCIQRSPNSSSEAPNANSVSTAINNSGPLKQHDLPATSLTVENNSSSHPNNNTHPDSQIRHHQLSDSSQKQKPQSPKSLSLPSSPSSHSSPSTPTSSSPSLQMAVGGPESSRVERHRVITPPPSSFSNAIRTLSMEGTSPGLSLRRGSADSLSNPGIKSGGVGGHRLGLFNRIYDDPVYDQVLFKASYQYILTYF
ncbi:unnamed protein product [Protopolystoma xenopodis]|uniref:GIT Spa2 homology (SHD) domain-containing protein n=1 Tax=Protopolystoma xenopodis TaxID=117903 RepID=A0A448WCM8_9PLAT|nr:unnamed protein product [Protopolystoma xenopodis]